MLDGTVSARPRPALQGDAHDAGEDGAPTAYVVLPIGQRGDGGGDDGAPLLPEEKYVQNNGGEGSEPRVMTLGRWVVVLWLVNTLFYSF